MSTKTSAGRVRKIYKFIELHKAEYSVQAMCRVLDVAPSGYYAWLQQPISSRAMENARLLRLIRKSFVASHGIYGAPRVFLDLREAGETCSKHRVARLMRQNNLCALHGYRTRRIPAGRPSIQIPNLLQRQFTVTQPNRAWVTDITYCGWGPGVQLGVFVGDHAGDELGVYTIGLAPQPNGFGIVVGILGIEHED